MINKYFEDEEIQQMFFIINNIKLLFFVSTGYRSYNSWTIVKKESLIWKNFLLHIKVN